MRASLLFHIDQYSSSSTDQYEIEDLLSILKNASTDENLSAVYINVSQLDMGWNDAIRIADAVKNIKESKKRVISYAETYTNYSYLIASQAWDAIK